jgi:hypothetical protein
MGKIKQAPQAAPDAADASWKEPAALQLHPDIQQELGEKQKTTFHSYTVKSHVHPQTNETIPYHQIEAYKPNRIVRRPTRFYACLGPQHVCTAVHLYDDQIDLKSHIKHQHKPQVQCPICNKLWSPFQYNAHYRVCSRMPDATQARGEQTDDIDHENDILRDEQNDAKQQASVIDAESKLIDEIDDDYQPRSKPRDFCAYSTPLLRIETLQYFDLNSPVLNNKTGEVEYKEWAPECCDQADNCNVVQKGTFVRFCYDTSEAYLVEIKRYKCTTHYTGKQKKGKVKDNASNVTFNMLSDCVSKQMSDRQTIRKSLDVYAFDTVLMTADLWTTIANNSLVTLNDSHVNTMIKHSYRRRWRRKVQLHMDHMRVCNPNHQCTARDCYGLTMNKADEWMNLYHTITERAIDIVTTRAIYQRHIVPTALIPLHNQQQRHIITECCSSAISMDHTFKMAKFGRYNEHFKDAASLAATATTLADTVMQTEKQPDSTATDKQASAPGPAQVVGKRRYNQSVIFNKLTAQLLTVMDSNGFALCSYVVPSGKSSYQLRCLQQLLKMQHESGRPISIKTVSVDNASQVGQSLKQHYTMLTNEELTVLQDLYHARERIEREFVFGHPLIREARADWRKLIGDVINAKCTIDVWKKNMEAYRDKYTAPVKYSAVGEMAMVSQLAKSLITDPIQREQVLSGEEMVNTYSRHHPNDVDNSNNIEQAVLRKPGVTALNNLISDANIAYVFDRTQAHCINSKGTTPNEALHRIFNGRLSRFGGIRTFATAQQSIIVIQYQYNSQRLHNTSQYWCELWRLPIDSIRQRYTDPLGEPDKDVLQRLEIEWSTSSKWTASHTFRLNQYLIELSTGKLYCHTKSLCQWLSQQDGMDGTNAAQIGKKLREMQAALTRLSSPEVPVITSSSSA